MAQFPCPPLVLFSANQLRSILTLKKLGQRRESNLLQDGCINTAIQSPQSFAKNRCRLREADNSSYLNTEN